MSLSKTKLFVPLSVFVDKCIVKFWLKILKSGDTKLISAGHKPCPTSLLFRCCIYYCYFIVTVNCTCPSSPSPPLFSHEVTCCSNYLFHYRAKQLVNIYWYVYTYQSLYQDINRNFLSDICIVSTCVITTSYLRLPLYGYG